LYLQFFSKAVKVIVTETFKWHIGGEIVDRNPKLGEEKIDKFFSESTDVSQNQSVTGNKESERASVSSEEPETSPNGNTKVEATAVQNKEGNLSNLFLILGALFLALGFVGSKLFD